MRYSIMLITAFLLLFTATSWAQKFKKPKLKEATKTALQEHYKTKIYPTKKAIHDELMLQLSEADHSLLESQRTSYQALHQEQRQVMQQLRKERKAGRTTIDRATAMAPIRQKRQAILEVLAPLLERHQEAIKKAMEALKNHKSEWKVERKTIMTQYESAEFVEQLEKRQARRKDHNVPKKDGKAAHFLLWDGQPKGIGH